MAHKEKIIVATAPTLKQMIETTDVGKRYVDAGFRIEFPDSFTPPFTFDADKVVAVVAGNKGNEMFGSREMDLFPHCRIISPFGIGYDHIDCAEAARRGVLVTNVPGVSRKSVAELTLCLILSLAHRVPECDALLKSGAWERPVGWTFAEKTLGIVGLGAIGKEVATHVRPFEARILAHDISYDEAFLENHPYVTRVPFEELLKESDIITLHVPRTGKTEHMINADSIGAMKDGVVIVNTARGSVIDERSLLEALESGKVSGAALEVFSTEPPFTDPTLQKLIALPNVIVTPHIATFTPEVRRAVALRILENITAVLDGRHDEADIVSSLS